MRVSKKQLTSDLKESVFDPRAPGRFSATIDGMDGAFVANTGLVRIREALAAFSQDARNGPMLEAALRDGISLLAYSRSMLKQTRDVVKTQDGCKAGPPFGTA